MTASDWPQPDAACGALTRAAAAGLACQGPWRLAWASLAGSRHAAVGKPCEDTLAHRFHPDGVVAAGAADGVSGGALGEVASFAAAGHCTDWTWTSGSSDVADLMDLTEEQDPPAPARLPPVGLQAHVAELDTVVRNALARHTARSGASTLAAIWLQADGTGWLCQVGDVRVYVWTPPAVSPDGSANPANEPGTLDCITRDQTYTVLGELPAPGVPGDNPARMLGNGSALAPALQPLRLEPGQALLLCTDGLHGFLTEREIAHALQAGLRQNASMARMAQTCRRLLRRALQNQGDDDIAVMLLARGG